MGFADQVRVAIQAGGVLVDLPLEILVIGSLLRGSYKRFPLIFVYAILTFLATVMEIPSTAAYLFRTEGANRWLADYWWLNEGVFQALNYLVVMSLIYQATAMLRSRRMLRASLFVGAVLFAGITFLIHYNPSVLRGAWMTPWTRDLNFCSAVLDMALWVLLISRREKDHRVLMLSGGMGILFTGEAIGESLRQLAMRDRSHALAFTGSILGMLANLALMFIWWKALRGPSGGNDQTAAPSRATVGSHR